MTTINFGEHASDRAHRRKRMRDESRGYDETSMQKFRRELIQKVEARAEQMAALFHPKLIGDSFADHWEEFHLLCQAKINELVGAFQPNTAYHRAATATKTASEAVQRLVNDEGKLKSKKAELETTIESLEPSYRTSFLHLLIIKGSIAAIVITEAAFMVPVAQDMDMNLVEAVLVSLGFGSVLAWYAHILPHLVAWVESPRWLRKAWAIFLGLITATGFWFISDIRADFLNRTASVNGVEGHFTAWPFTCISMVLLLVATVLPLIYYPSEEDMEVKKKLVTLKKEKAAIDKKLAKIAEARKAETTAKNSVHTDSFSDLEQGYSLQQQLITIAKEGFSRMKQTNFLHRTDGKPDCKNDAYPFTFATPFNDVTP